MITQLILDFAGSVMVLLYSSIPPLPSFMVDAADAVGGMTDTSTQTGAFLSYLGVLIPWNTFGNVFEWWLGVLAFWIAMVLLRGVLTAFGR